MGLAPKYIFSVFLGVLFFSGITAQNSYQQVYDIPVIENSDTLEYPWAGGINAGQFGRIDVDRDGKEDIFIFDRSGKHITILLNKSSSPGERSYEHTDIYDMHFPPLQNWVLLRDYDQDGNKDLFVSTNGSVGVYRNTASDSTELGFEKVTDQVMSDYYPDDPNNQPTNLYVSSADIPAIGDVDGDGDLDVLTFGLLSSTLMEYHKNLSMELYGVPDSLVFEVRNKCWGFFREGNANNDIFLQDSCNYNVDNPEMPTPEEGQNYATYRHSGSTVMMFDENGDGVQDLILGDISFSNLVMLTNGGTTDASLMTAKDTAFPSYDSPARVDVFPATFYEDVNNDGKRDLLVSPNKTQGAENQESVWYYRNTNTDANPTFSLQQKDLFQDEMIDVGEGALPVLFDFNADSLPDLFVANYISYQPGGSSPSHISLYQNTGTASSPSFDLVTTDFENLSSLGIGEGLYPTFGDLDNDGDADMMIGAANGKLYYFQNTAGAGNPVNYTLQQAEYQDKNANVIDVGNNATPQLYDVNRDGSIDLLIGCKGGHFYYYENTGTPSSPSFQLVDDTLGDVLVSDNWAGYSVPHMFEDSGSTRLISGNYDGFVTYYGNIDDNLTGTFSERSTNVTQFREGYRTGVARADLNHDSIADLIVGNYCGGLSFYKGSPPTSINTQASSAPAPPRIYPNPAQEAFTIEFHQPLKASSTLTLFNAMGKKVRERSITERSTRISTQDLPKGLYFGRITGGEQHSFPIVVQP